ncbi:chromate reductase [Rhodovulum imhoffii]|uniref:Chromate reductase n=1 Tax=Rhodovulum imhoffii TaxID=365340 RepID=A0A2T5BU85_9RHOB|nr:NAD(P)H-dependent oxidoreductase [Rhodovulum imhoffii]MBK5934550.1 NADPH-dependent FMN reductase [Rhodovulum imhoffii]PTN03033.1 chromate reductase [Rhodovulum imhoffii]
MTYTLLGISGSLRKGSFNTHLLREAARHFGPAHFTLADLRVPLYDADLEAAEGLPAEVARLAGLISGADAVVISAPEYNRSISGVLKNALDWVSRVPGGPWAGKPVAILSATAGRSGGERTQYALRLCLTPFGARVLTGPEVLVGQAADQFDNSGRLTNEINTNALAALMAALRDEVAR